MRETPTSPDRLDADDISWTEFIKPREKRGLLDGVDSGATSTTAIIKRCVHAADSKDLIAELRLRGRLQWFNSCSEYYAEMILDDSYMRSVERGLAVNLAQSLHDKGLMKIEDRTGPDRVGPIRNIRTASLVVLISESQALETAAQAPVESRVAPDAP